MVLFFSILQKTLCTAEELLLHLNKLKETTENYKISCRVLESELKNISSNICTENATESQKQYVYDAYVDTKK